MNSRGFAIAVCAVVLGASSVLLFARLGRYAPWDDESLTIMTARGVWRTGDTSAWSDDGRNLLAYRDGLLIHNFKDRYTSPLQFYLLAPVVGLFGTSNFVARAPFALGGVISVCILLRWLWRARPTSMVWAIAALAILTNVEFFLFFRQARYYGLAMVLTVAAGYVYWHLGHRRRGVWALSLLLVLLLRGGGCVPGAGLRNLGPAPAAAGPVGLARAARATADRRAVRLFNLESADGEDNRV
jgi:4-amino-4-deoxy-L-arabinose transferase-like glycosyltransferase